MTDLASSLEAIDAASDEMLDTVIRLARQNSGSYNLPGLAAMLDMAIDLYKPMAEHIEKVDLPPIESISDRGEIERIPLGQAGRLRARPDAPIQVLFVGHYDTVFGREHPFQDVRVVKEDVLSGPGVADMKGGLVVLQAALAALERSEARERIGWEIILNPDEELGSVGSAGLLEEAAAGKNVGFIFEPTFPNGNLASERKGSGTFHLIARGRAAHAGRDHHLGRNAIAGLAAAIQQIHGLNGRWPDTTINIGYVHGGGPTNIVPDVAVAKLNVRVPDQATADLAVAAIETIAREITERDVQIEVGGGFTRPPKPMTPEGRQLLEFVAAAGSDLNLTLGWEPTGGVSDGNNLAAAGLSNVDNLGVLGGNIHSDQEYLIVPSLAERAKLAAIVLIRLARGEFAGKDAP